MAEQTTDDDAGLAPLKEQIKAANEATAAERAARQAAEKAALEAEGRIAQEVSRRVAADKSAVSNAIAATTTALEVAKAKLAEAGKAQDWSALADAQEEIAGARVKLDQFKDRAAQITTWETREIERIKSEAQRPSDPLDVYSPKTKTWLKSHPELLQGNMDNPKMKKAIAAHFEAEAEGLVQDTPEYFEYLDTKLGYRQQEDNTPPVRQQQNTHTDMDGLPPSRGNGAGGSSTQKNQVRLSASEQEIARISFPHLPEADALKEYARMKVELQNEGRL